jgi:hypothetical protein
MVRGLLPGLLTLVVLVVLVGLLGSVGAAEVGLAVVVAAVIGWLVARRTQTRSRPVR